MNGRRASGGGASWLRTSRWRYRKIDEGEREPIVRYADTLKDIRTDFIEDEDAFEYEIEQRQRTGEDVWTVYGTLFFGPSGPVLKR